MKGIIKLWIIGFLWIVHSTAEASAQFDAGLTLQNVWGRLLVDSRSIIQCISDDNYKYIRFSRKLDTGQDARLPKLSQQFMQAKPVFARILFMPGEDKLNRFGAFQCKITIQGVVTDIVTLKLPPSNIVEIDSLSPYNVASVNDRVELEVNVTKKFELPIKWRHNGVDVPAWDNLLRVEIPKVQQTDSGIYECFYEGRRNKSAHALMRLIVRGCDKDKYGEDCEDDCPPCYNGGVCHEVWGLCVCPAGFTGENCEIACGGNHFGEHCSNICSPPQKNSNTDELCASHLFCKPDPYGCSCAPGFKGSNCMEHCEPGWYGADCRQPCHCAYGISSCNRITGACQGGCAKGWRGHSCQIDDPNANSTMETTTMVYCPLGWYGPSCERVCHCAENEHCHVVTGHCPSGCEEGWGGPSCGACRPGRFGDNCEFTCHCEEGHHNCDKDGFCHGGCEAGWAGFTCQTECTPGRFGTNCASTCHCYENSTTPCDKITGVCEGDCEAGYMGSDCQILCPQNKYGVNCVHDCFCINGGHCNRIDGSCACEGRWKGQICNESEPQIVAATDEEVNAGQQVFISCTADAVPEPVMEISSSSSGSDDLHVHIRSLEQNQYQAVIKVKPKDAGQLEFLCKARNQHGFDMKKMTLTVIESPRLTSPPWLLSKTNLSLTVGWRDWVFSKDTGGSPTDRIEYMVMYRKLEASNWDRVDGWSTDLSNTASGLTPNTQYEVAIKCRRLGKGGEGDVSPSLSVKTDCGECSPGRFGTNCASTCHCHESSTTSCDKITGVCEGDCEAGYMGSDCQTLCPINKYGVNCFHDCLCINGGHCNRIDGSCACEGRWKGEICNERKPRIVIVTDEEVNAGQQVFISCRAEALPVPEMEISSNFSGSGGLQVYMKSPDKDQYQIDVLVKPKDAGQQVFICKARNQHGIDTKKITLTVIEPPRLTSPPWLTDLSSLSLTLLWRGWVFSKDAGGSPIDKIEYMVMYRNLEASSWENADGWSTELSKTVKDLKPNTWYEIAIKCRRLGKEGEGDVSPSIRVKTDCGAATVDGIATDVLPSHRTESSITLVWKRPLEDHLRCILEGYYLSYQPEASEATVYEKYLDAEANSATLEDLIPSATYIIRLYAITPVQRSEYFVELTLKTADINGITHLECSAVDENPSLLTVSWEPASKAKGDDRGYIVTYTLLDRGHCGQEFVDSIASRKIVTNDTEITLSDLHPYSIYNVSVRARTATGESDPVSVSATTAESKPSEPPSNVRVISSTSRSLLIHWDPVPCREANGIITHYEYFYFPFHMKRKKRTLVFPVYQIIEGLEVDIKNLEPSTVYGFIVRGVTKAGAGHASHHNYRTDDDDDDDSVN